MVYNILIAEDEVIERQLLQETISSNYHSYSKIFIAENGIEAIHMLEKEQIHICILDIEMPGLTGIEVAMKIRESQLPCSIIFLTAFDNFSYAKKAINLHALDYLLKPYNEAELFTAIEEAMQIQNHLRDRKLSNPPQYSFDTLDFESKHFMAKEIVDYIEQHYNHDISITEIASQVHYSEAYFCKFFKENFNETFTLYLNKFRVHRAIELFKDQRASIKEISAAVGYSDQNYFTRVFKRITGITPSQYRQNID